MDVLKIIVQYGSGNPLVCSLLLALVYPALYLVFRACGKLSVNGRGWHAGSVYWGGRVVLSALRLFAFFQPLLRLESFAFRRFDDRRGKMGCEAKISDVIVEVVRMA